MMLEELYCLSWVCLRRLEYSIPRFRPKADII